jgi:hypothetical protein
VRKKSRFTNWQQIAADEGEEINDKEDAKVRNIQTLSENGRTVK